MSFLQANKPLNVSDRWVCKAGKPLDKIAGLVFCGSIATAPFPAAPPLKKITEELQCVRGSIRLFPDAVSLHFHKESMKSMLVSPNYGWRMKGHRNEIN